MASDDYDATKKVMDSVPFRGPGYQPVDRRKPYVKSTVPAAAAVPRYQPHQRKPSHLNALYDPYADSEEASSGEDQLDDYVYDPSLYDLPSPSLSPSNAALSDAALSDGPSNDPSDAAVSDAAACPHAPLSSLPYVRSDYFSDHELHAMDVPKLTRHFEEQDRLQGCIYYTLFGTCLKGPLCKYAAHHNSGGAKSTANWIIKRLSNKDTRPSSEPRKIFQRT
jgi:hypothetical protein